MVGLAELRSCLKLRRRSHFAEADDRAIRDFNSQRLAASSLRKALFEMNTLPGIQREIAGNRHVNVARPVADFHALSQEVPKRRHKRSLRRG